MIVCSKYSSLETLPLENQVYCFDTPKTNSNCRVNPQSEQNLQRKALLFRTKRAQQVIVVVQLELKFGTPLDKKDIEPLPMPTTGMQWVLYQFTISLDMIASSLQKKNGIKSQLKMRTRILCFSQLEIRVTQKTKEKYLLKKPMNSLKPIT